ncbi:MAG: haloacid dehalogenase-like hydrolase [Ignavibacteriales bacterium]|nr:haloacid dehalogenase-like hydrolase [Ignavibacteriales bacterium]
MRASDQAIERVAVFDLDGTLLIGDIGDAVFAYLILEGHRLTLSWGEYQHLLRTHKSKAYRTVVEAMAGLEPDTIVRATSAVMNAAKEYLTLGSDRVRKPKPRPLLSQFVSLLHQLQYQVFVISASNHVSVQHVSQAWFNVPPSHAFGIQSRTFEGRLTAELLSPVPIGPGKAELFRLAAGSAVPLITGTDSALDIPLLRITHPMGFTVWLGDNPSDYNAAMATVKGGQKIFFAGSDEEPESDDY